MARLFTLGGEEICSLVHLSFEGEAFSADVAPHVAAQRGPGEAILRTSSGEARRVTIDSWEIEEREGRQMGRVHGTVLASPPRS
jgi:hypothetical protein